MIILRDLFVGVSYFMKYRANAMKTRLERGDAK